jgi:hypothetical protein
VVIRDLRRALGDDARRPRFIETVAKRGYRLALEGQAGRVSPAAVRLWLAMVAIIAAIAVFALTSQSHIVLAVEPVRNETGQERYDPLSRALTQLLIDRTSKLAGVTVAAEGAEGRLRLEARLILWNGTPALGLTATDPSDGHVVWSGIAEGEEDVIAKLTAAKVREFGRKLHYGAGSDE